MATPIRLERSATVVMEAYTDGSYHEYTVEGAHLWGCPICKLVWEKKWHAETCESRGHVSSFEQGPYGVARIENGRPVGNLHYYTRRAVRQGF